jgi:hypothetical protein
VREADKLNRNYGLYCRSLGVVAYRRAGILLRIGGVNTRKPAKKENSKR